MAVTTKYGQDDALSMKKQTTSQERKKYGLAFPLGQIISGGAFAKSSGSKMVRDGLMQLLKTERGERVMLPNYGVSLKKYLFQPLDEQTFENIKSEILTSISRYTPNVEVLKIGVFDSETLTPYGLPGILINLMARIKDSENLIFDLQVELG